MRRGRTLIFVLLIVIIGLAVGFFALRQFTAAPATPVAPVGVEVFIASQNIAQGGEITEVLLTTITIPPENVLTVMYTRDEMPLLVGKVAKFPLDQGVVITESMVGNASSAPTIPGPQWASLIPSGMTALTIPADRLSLAGYGVTSGAHVNVNACFLFVDIDPAFQTILPNQTAAITGTGFTAEGTPPVLSLGVSASGSPQGRLELDPSLQQPYYLIPSEAQQRPRMVCQMLLQDVTVMQVGDFPLDKAADLTAAVPVAPVVTTDPAAAPPPTTPAPRDIVTLLVSPQDSITLSYLILTDAELSLAIRNPTDQARQATEASTLQFLLSQYNIPVPAKLPYSLNPTRIDFFNIPDSGPAPESAPTQ